MSSDADYIKKVIRHNLVIDIKREPALLTGANVVVSLSFKDEGKPFSIETVFLPDGD